MNARSQLPFEPVPDAGERTPAPAEIRAQLDRILESPPFRTSKRCSAFLKYVVEGSCEGRGELLKERNLGVSVFDRTPDYDTNQDPVVRNTAGQVRKRLAQYYCEPGRDQELRIDLPPGAYIPDIHAPFVRAAVPVSEIPPPVAEPAAPLATARKWPWFAAAALILVAVAAVLLSQRHKETVLDQFWAPLLKSPGTVVLCVGQGHTYKLPPELDRAFEKAAGASLPAGSVKLSEIVPAWDRYIGLQDAQATLRVATLFTSYGKETELRGGRATEIANLRGRPAVLIGGFNNEWTLSLTGELRFYFEDDVEHHVNVVRDRLHPENRAWKVSSEAPLSEIPADYAIITRVFNATTEQTVVVAAGIKGAGTFAAGEFLTSPTYLAEALHDAPPNWAARNVQFVIATRMFGGHPGPAKAIAAHYW